MMDKRTLAIGTVIAVIVLSSLVSVVGIQTVSSNDKEEIYFEDARILLIGRCRTIVSGGEDPWTGGLVIGHLDYAGVDICDTPREGICILARNGLNRVFFLGPTNYTVFLRNASGIFFWGAKGSGASEVPPFVFIWCHSERAWIREPGWEP